MHILRFVCQCVSTAFQVHSFALAFCPLPLHCDSFSLRGDSISDHFQALLCPFKAKHYGAPLKHSRRSAIHSLLIAANPIPCFAHLCDAAACPVNATLLLLLCYSVQSSASALICSNLFPRSAIESMSTPLPGPADQCSSAATMGKVMHLNSLLFHCESLQFWFTAVQIISIPLPFYADLDCSPAGPRSSTLLPSDSPPFRSAQFISFSPRVHLSCYSSLISLTLHCCSSAITAP